MRKNKNVLKIIVLSLLFIFLSIVIFISFSKKEVKKFENIDKTEIVKKENKETSKKTILYESIEIDLEEEAKETLESSLKVFNFSEDFKEFAKDIKITNNYNDNFFKSNTLIVFCLNDYTDVDYNISKVTFDKHENLLDININYTCPEILKSFRTCRYFFVTIKNQTITEENKINLNIKEAIE